MGLTYANVEDNFPRYISDYNILNNPRIFQQSSSTFENFLRPPFYCPPFVHWLPGQYAVEDLRGGGLTGASIGKHRRNRTAFSQQQLALLERSFADTQYPDLETRDRLSRSTGLPETKIQVWFKNRRAKHRKLQKANEKALSPIPSSSSSQEKQKGGVSASSSLLSPLTMENSLSKKEIISEICDGGNDISVHENSAVDIKSFMDRELRKPTHSHQTASEGSPKHQPYISNEDNLEAYCDNKAETTSGDLASTSSHPSAFCRRNFSFPYMNNLESHYLPLMYSPSANPWPFVYYGTTSSIYPPTTFPNHPQILPSTSYNERLPTEELHSNDIESQFADKKL